MYVLHLKNKTALECLKHLRVNENEYHAAVNATSVCCMSSSFMSIGTYAQYDTKEMIEYNEICPLFREEVNKEISK